jgi:hypothetical protein
LHILGQVARLDWVLLAYRLPREPSTPRITIWRKLRRLGASQLVDGLVALPADARTKEQLEWVADEVLEAGGEATVWLGRPGSAADERRIAAKMSRAVAEEYRAVIVDAKRIEGDPPRRSVSRLQRELQRIDRRCFFTPPEREEAHVAVRTLAARLGEEAVSA